MTTWIRANIQFDLPSRVYTLMLRSAAGQQFHRFLGGVDPHIASKEGQLAVENAMLRLLAEYRPALDSTKWIVVSMNLGPGSFKWHFWVMHPDLPRVEPFAEIPTERLEKCHQCHEPLSEKSHYTVVSIGLDQKVVEVCEKCSKAPATVEKPCPGCNFAGNPHGIGRNPSGRGGCDVCDTSGYVKDEARERA